MIIIPKSNLYEAKINFNQFDLVDFNVTKSGERFFAKRVRLRSNKFTHFITRLLMAIFTTEMQSKEEFYKNAR